MQSKQIGMTMTAVVFISSQLLIYSGCEDSSSEQELGTYRAALTEADCPAGYNIIIGTEDNAKRSGIPKDSARRILVALRETGTIVEVRPGLGRRAAVLRFPDLLRIANES